MHPDRPEIAPPAGSVLLRLRGGGGPASLLVGRSASMRRVVELARRVAATPRTTVLVQGESGVGKELLARAVHELSTRAARPLVAVNCASLAEGLTESELFGYEPGAFTGADPRGRPGLFAAAEGGTLLLDEIAELAPLLQAKLLRVLQERVVRRVGGDRDLPADVRIVAVTHRDLSERVAAGAFREDLFYRLNVLCLRIPALRERPEDVRPLARHLAAELACEQGLPYAPLGEAVLAHLEGHPWPGNVRELRNGLERGLLMAGGEPLAPEHLELGREPDAALPAGGALPLGDRSLRGMEEALIRRVLADERGNRSRSAVVLGINRATLYNKLRVYSIA